MVRMVCIVLLALGTGRSTMGQTSASATVENHIHQVIESLPPSSQIRHELENGARGDGVHYPWMDEMRRQGIKKALVVIRFEWHGHPTQMSLVKTIYFDKYDTDCAQITAPAMLDKIQESRLPQMLQSYAMSLTEKSHWFAVDQKIRGKRGQSNVELLDDEWLPRHPPLLAIPQSGQGLSGLSLGDEISVAQFTSRQNVSVQERNEALTLAASVIDDSCVIETLLHAGADANTRGAGGMTPLMISAETGHSSNVRALILAGADVYAKDVHGRTALWFAEQGKQTEIIEVLKAAQEKREKQAQ